MQFRSIMMVVFLLLAVISHAEEPSHDHEDSLGVLLLFWPEEERKQVDSRLLQAIALHNQGAEEENVEAVIQSLALLEDLRKEHPEDMFILAFLGSSSTLRARDAPLRERLDWLKRGGEYLDEAVQKDPDNAKVRLVRAMNSYQLPAIFGRHPEAKEDFAKLLSMIESEESTVPEPAARYILYHAGLFASRQREVEEARKRFHAALAMEGDIPTRHDIELAIDQIRRPLRPRSGRL